MTNKNCTLSLINPPIIEAVIGISYVDISIDRLRTLYTKDVEHIYPLKENTKSVSIQIGKSGDCISHSDSGFKISTQDKKTMVILEKNRTTIVDKNKYIDFKNILEKYRYIYKKIGIITIKDIGFKCVNKFDLDLTKNEHNKFLIRPVIALGTTKLNEFFLVTRLFKDSSLFADVKAIIKPKSNTSLEAIFEIDCHKQTNLESSHIDIEKILLELRYLRNEIFINNIHKDFIDEKFNK